MDLELKNKRFVICGATSGFGEAMANQLIEEGAHIIAIARNEEALVKLQSKAFEQVEILCGDITQSDTIDQLKQLIGDKYLSGIVVNAGGPPARTFIETSLSDWDEAYNKLLRWKVEITHAFLPKFREQGYGRFLYIESSSVKQPIENLILSTSLRLAVVGMMKTISEEHAQEGITFNVMAPSFHNTPAVDRLVQKKADTLGISFDEARELAEKNLKLGKAGNPEDFASLGLWLLSERSSFVTGQVYAVEGGNVKSTL